MMVRINKLMRHPSHESDEVDAINIYEDPKILSSIKETMTFIEDWRIEEPKYDPFPFSATSPKHKSLPSTLKYAFLDHQRAKPVIIFLKIEKD